MLNPEWGDALRYLVLDEAHTYEGRRGADVAMLVRRVKRRMGGRGRIRCIATSATIVKSDDETRAFDDVRLFFRQLFGEDLHTYITEEEEELPPATYDMPKTLPADMALIDAYVLSQQAEDAWALAEALFGRALAPTERNLLSLQTLLDGRLHVLVDGSIHYEKWIREVDQQKRDRLADEGYQIFEFDMGNEDTALRRLRERL